MKPLILGVVPESARVTKSEVSAVKLDGMVTVSANKNLGQIKKAANTAFIKICLKFIKKKFIAIFIYLWKKTTKNLLK